MTAPLSIKPVPVDIPISEIRNLKLVPSHSYTINCDDCLTQDVTVGQMKNVTVNFFYVLHLDA